ncbi:MAG: CvpA family protein [Clostridiales Family XIII bacterium]|nr:CvpA family protein [Clostridiales Family XIII bacterium]
MQLDILIILIVFASAMIGYRSGLVRTVLRAFGWLLSIAIAALLYPYANELLSANTDVYDNIRSGIEARFSAHVSAKAGVFLEDVPNVIAEAVNKLVSTFSVSVADGVAAVCFKVFVYLALLLAVKLLAFLLSLLFSKRSRGKGLIGGIDGILGFVFGAVRGMLIVLVLLALILPVSLLISESANAAVSDMLFASAFAGKLYNGNPLLLLTGGFLSL